MEGANFAVHLSRLSLSIVGVWPHTECSRIYMMFSDVILSVSLLLASYFIFAPQTTQLFLVDGDLDMIVDILCTCDLPLIVAFVKMIILRYDTEDVKSLLCIIFEDWKLPRSVQAKSRMYHCAKTGRKISATCLGLAYSTANLLLLSRLYLLPQRQAKVGRRVFLYESYFPYNHSPWYEITWIFQYFCTLSITTANSGIDSFFAVLVLHLCGQFVILGDELHELNDYSGDVRRKIIHIAKRHNELNSFAKTIEEVFNKMFLAHIVASAVQFCLQGYQLFSIATDRSDNLPILDLSFMASYMMYLLLDLYIHCYVAEELRDKSVDLFDAAYNSKWYNLKRRETYDLTFIMKRAQYPLEITAGKFCYLSLSLFASIGKTSLGYLSMLLVVKERNRHVT